MTNETRRERAHGGVMLFRLHRGAYADSMRTVREVRSIADINAAIAPDEVVRVEKYGPPGTVDPRNGWDTHIVIGGSGPVGMTSGPID